MDEYAKRWNSGGSENGVRSRLHETKEDTDDQIDKHDIELQTTFACIKHPWEQEKGRLRKKFKATKTSLDPITLVEGNLHDTRDTV